MHLYVCRYIHKSAVRPSVRPWVGVCVCVSVCFCVSANSGLSLRVPLKILAETTESLNKIITSHPTCLLSMIIHVCNCLLCMQKCKHTHTYIYIHSIKN